MLNPAVAFAIVSLTLPPSGRVHLPGGTFEMGSTPLEMERALQLCEKELYRTHCRLTISPLILAEGHAHEVMLRDFWLDRTEVTVTSYRRCVAARVCTAPFFDEGDVEFDQPSFPVTHVSVDDARTYCAYRGGRLPTEAEWEFAARGNAHRIFPWGNVYNPKLSNHGSFASNEVDAQDGFAGLAPVGSFPDGATPLGILDLAGNVNEWVDGYLETDDVGFGYPPASMFNPKPGIGGGRPISRGGSYLEGATWVRNASRGRYHGTRSSTVGIRCAYDP